MITNRLEKINLYSMVGTWLTLIQMDRCSRRDSAIVLNCLWNVNLGSLKLFHCWHSIDVSEHEREITKLRKDFLPWAIQNRRHRLPRQSCQTHLDLDWKLSSVLLDVSSCWKIHWNFLCRLRREKKTFSSTHLKRCMEWNLGSSVSLSRPIEVWRWSLGKAVFVSSSESRSLKIELILLGRLTLLLPTLVALDSDCSMLLALGVTTPPPSTEIGMMNSLGDFLIGCLSLFDEVTVDVDCMNDWVGVVSDSLDSLVDWRESEFL